MTVTVSPEDIKKVKAEGLLHNKGTDNFSARVLTTNGKVNASQLQCISEAAALYGNGNVVMTTRLTLEVQGIHFDRIMTFRCGEGFTVKSQLLSTFLHLVTLHTMACS